MAGPIPDTTVKTSQTRIETTPTFIRDRYTSLHPMET
jgi:hypothetical protein